MEMLHRLWQQKISIDLFQAYAGMALERNFEKAFALLKNIQKTSTENENNNNMNTATINYQFKKNHYAKHNFCKNLDLLSKTCPVCF